MSKGISKTQRDHYLKFHGCACPFCESPRLESGTIYVDDYVDDGLYTHVTCTNCGKKWTDHYSLTNITVEDEE